MCYLKKEKKATVEMMDDLIRIAFLGWHDEARCLLETWGRDESLVRVVGLVLPPGSACLGPADIPIPTLVSMSELVDLSPVSCALDLRPPGSARPEDLPEGVVWIPPDGVRIIEDLCVRQTELRRYKGVVDTAADAVVTIDESHRIVFYNQAAERMFGFSKEEAVGQDLSLIIPSPHRAKHREYVRRYVDTRAGRFIDHTVELTAERRSGEEFPISISFSVAEEGGHLLMTAVMRDTTEIKGLEKRALQNERLVSVGQALSYVTHEIKNPLIVIGGFARSLLKSDSFREEDRNRLEIIGKEVQRLEGLLEEIQDFAKPLRLDREAIHLAAFLRETLSLFRGADTSPRVEFSLEAKGDLVVSADPDRLRQVLLNLVKNALEATSGEGRVAVRAWEEGETVFLEIQDTGEGIPPARLEEIFQPFVTTKKGGSGLGLPLCRKIVRDHGGEITICSEPGEGTKVLLTFPSSRA